MNERLEDMGMTEGQWKERQAALQDELKLVREFLEGGNTEKADEMLTRMIERIEEYIKM